MNENKDYIIQIIDLEEGKTQYISYISEKNFEITNNINESKRISFDKAKLYCNNILKNYDTKIHKVRLTIIETILDTKI